MLPRLLHPVEYELLERTSSESNDTFNLDDTDFESQGLTSTSYVHNQRLYVPNFLFRSIPLHPRAVINRYRFRQRHVKGSQRHRFGLFKALHRRICFILVGIGGTIFILLFVTTFFRPSYTNPPAHYQTLKSRILSSSEDGRGNPNNKKIFIATSLYDKGGHLVNGAWGKAVLDLISILGEKNVFLSIYENDSGPEAHAPLDAFKLKVQGPNSLVFEEHISFNDIPHITLPNGSKRIKRMAYLAEVRNRALRPLEESSAFNSTDYCT